MNKSSRKSVVISDKQFHAIMHTLADARRFAIFEQIAASGEIACSALQEHTQISPATISHHIKELSEAGLIEVQREGRTAHLTLCRSVFKAYLTRLARLTSSK